MNAIEVFLIGFIILGGIVWQLAVLPKYNRLIPTAVFSVIVFLGVLTWGIFSMIAKYSYDFWDFCTTIGKTIVFIFVLNAKSYFGPLYLTVVLSATVYNLFEDGALGPIPVVSALIGWLFKKGPSWLATLYIVLMGLYALAGSVFDTAADG